MAGVRLTVVGDEMRAEALCGMLRTNGIACSYPRPDVSAGIGTYGGGLAMAGPTEVVVNEAGLKLARTSYGTSSSVTRKPAVLRQCSAVTLERTLCEDCRVLREVAAE
jgi:hypothetical protein